MLEDRFKIWKLPLTHSSTLRLREKQEERGSCHTLVEISFSSTSNNKKRKRKEKGR